MPDEHCRNCGVVMAARSWLGFLVSAVVLSGCMSSGLYETARCAPPGRTEHTFAVETGAVLRARSGLIGGFEQSFTPTPLYTLRLGLFRNCDLGLRLGLCAAGLSAKYTFWDGEPAIAFVADASGSFFFSMGVGATTGAALAGRLLVSSEPKPVGYAVSLGVGYHQKDIGVELGSSLERSWDILASGGLPIALGERVRVMPVLSVGVPAWTRFTESGWEGDSSYVYDNPDIRRLSVSLGVSLSLLAPASEEDGYAPWRPSR
jgi:hypothetical protein